MPQHSVACALQCAEIRRHTMRTLLKEVVGYTISEPHTLGFTLTYFRMVLIGEMEQ